MQELHMIQPATEAACLHCQEPVPAPGERFCCNGCETVFGLLNSCGLSEYYQIRQNLGTLRKPRPVTAINSSFAYLDDPEQVLPIVAADGSRNLEFYLEGVHCAACIWLVEKLPDFIPGVLSARLNLSASTARISLNPDGQFALVASTLAKWGYRPHLLSKSADSESLARREQRGMLSRIGVAAFAAGNLMILAVALYAGVSGPLAHYFEWLSLVLVAPAVTYSAWPFYRSAWTQIVHQHRISIDVPIALSLVLGTLLGIWELAFGSRQIYFDSLAMLVFLLLFSRYTLLRTQQHVLRQDKLLSFYTPDLIEKLGANGFEPVPMNQLTCADVIRIPAGVRIPADGVVLAGESNLDVSVLTGETFPMQVLPGDTVYCGARNLQAELTLRLTALGSESRLGQILSRAQANLEAKTHLVRLADRLARWFVSIVLLLSAGLFLSFLAQPQVGLVRVLALAIISCPCALALATPLMIQISLKQALARGYFVRKAESLERLPDLNTIVFDKTGTLTLGRFELIDAEGLDQPEVRRALLAIESQSSHPVGRALVQLLLADGPMPIEAVTDFAILPTGGVAGTVAGTFWSIVPDADYQPRVAGHAMVCLKVLAAGQLVATLVLGDRLRPEAPVILAGLKASGYDLWLLSGDQPAACQTIAAQVGIDPERVLARQSPEQKEAFFAQHDSAMMVGDGINDMMAMSKAKAGVSVQGSAEENLQSADIYLGEQGLGQLPGLLRHARITRRMLVAALTFSLTYNVLGITAAVLGYVSPLVAAILMPLSALTVISLAMIGGRILCRS